MENRSFEKSFYAYQADLLKTDTLWSIEKRSFENSSIWSLPNRFIENRSIVIHKK